MSLIDIILSIILISVFCLGVRTLLSEGMIFHFLRKPFEYEADSKVMNFFRRKLQLMALQGIEGLQEKRRKYTKLSNKINHILKPFLICVLCFASFWGSIAFILLNGFHLKELIICCVCSVFVIKFISDHVEF